MTSGFTVVVGTVYPKSDGYTLRHLCYPHISHVGFYDFVCVAAVRCGYTTAGPEGAARERTYYTPALFSLTSTNCGGEYTRTVLLPLSLTIARSNVYFYYSLSRNAFTLSVPSFTKSTPC